jgi:deazaflavin-dependent oxidoreductase (nitroreductase family)
VGSKSYDLVWGTVLRTTTVLHRAIHTLSKGRLGRRFPGGAQVVWITTLGRRSGEWRRTPLLAIPDSGGWGIAGSNAGQEEIPGWVFNVRAHDQGKIEIDGEVSEAVFTEVQGEEAARIYTGLGDAWSSYRMYQRNIVREIPVFRVTKHDTPLSVGRAPQVEKHYSNRDKDNPDPGNRARARFKCDERDQKHGYGA